MWFSVLLRCFGLAISMKNSKLAILVLLLCSSVLHLAIADDNDKIIITCPAIEICSAGDTPKKVRNAAEDDLLAYDCYRYVGETDLAKRAAAAATKCQTIYGSDTATVLPTSR
ncbi:MAG: hypothetical protein QG673_1034 [Pseudomonadota bacterium]|nr:hypothetical protein [Pseudomonadota bacterium]